MSVRIIAASYHRTDMRALNLVLRDAQEQRAARLEAERKLVEFQEQLKKVLFYLLP
jgi:hypothetical protein